MTRPADWAQRERLVAQHAGWRCECIVNDGHGHGEERCPLRGDHAQPRGSRTDYLLPHLMWVCQPCARAMWPDRFGQQPVTRNDPTPTEVIELPRDVLPTEVIELPRDALPTEVIELPRLPRTLPLPVLG